MLEEMAKGNKVTHMYFDPKEWMKKTGQLYEFEDGCCCEPSMFWYDRDEISWEDDWRIYDEK